MRMHVSYHVYMFGGIHNTRLIHTGHFLTEEMLENLPDNYFIKATDNGSMEKGDVFNNWCQHFIKNLPPSQIFPVYLFGDGHVSRTSLEVCLFEPTQMRR